jgi:hypothetical protein
LVETRKKNQPQLRGSDREEDKLPGIDVSLKASLYSAQQLGFGFLNNSCNNATRLRIRLKEQGEVSPEDAIVDRIPVT